MSTPRSELAEASASTRFPAAVMVIAVLAAGACGRLGYQAQESDGDGGPPDARDGDGGSTPDGGPMPDGCDEVPLIVTTAADEDDAGEAPLPPHLGTGLSLREAIAIAGARVGLDCIQFSAPMAITVDTELPPLEDPAGTAIDGGGGVVITSAGAVPIGLRLVSGNNQVFNLEMSGILVCIQVNGTGNLLRGLHLHDCSSRALVVAAAANQTVIGPCLMHDNGGTAIQAVGTTGLEVVNCTLTANRGDGIDATAGGTDLLVENSISTENRDNGVAVDPGAVAAIEYSALQGNRLEDCLNCTLGEGSIASDPQFMDAVNDDYTLMTGSPAIDTGRVNGVDLNGGTAGDFNGLAPDMGGLESP